MAGESDWKPMLDKIARREEATRTAGGADELARQLAGGRLDARLRIDALPDAPRPSPSQRPGSARERHSRLSGSA